MMDSQAIRLHVHRAEEDGFLRDPDFVGSWTLAALNASGASRHSANGATLLARSRSCLALARLRGWRFWSSPRDTTRSGTIDRLSVVLPNDEFEARLSPVPSCSSGLSGVPYVLVITAPFRVSHKLQATTSAAPIFGLSDCENISATQDASSKWPVPPKLCPSLHQAILSSNGGINPNRQAEVRPHFRHIPSRLLGLWRTCRRQALE